MVEKQQSHYQTIGLRNKGKQWASKIITHNWQMIYKQWLGRKEVLHQKKISTCYQEGPYLILK
jgi:hypothetical protein